MSVLKRPHTWVIAAIVIVLIVLATRLLLTPRPAPGVEGEDMDRPAPAGIPENSQDAGAKSSSTGTAITQELPPIVEHDSAREFSMMLSAADKSAEDKIHAVSEILYFYRQAFGGENPPGHNELVVSALIGENEKRTALIPENSPAIKDGALVDQWGTPYWFHAISSKEMEVRSAGPDKELFTQDDLTLE